ncbi:hypothetical protein [Algicella marina]|uniref:Uncharacterized protein n=1 Tax=Algicella marina TaxID=2683284 RepID=A0A6P1T2F3_9RHOB|nr:hypothetical protein [Algicella marina]QHQ35901.1 hypothetical protein GO499_12310 [Algicella marina]
MAAWWETVNGWVATTRAIEWDPLWLTVLLFALVLLKYRMWPKGRVEREMPVRGGSYLGLLTPKTLHSVERAARLKALRHERKARQKQRGAYIHEGQPPVEDAAPPAHEMAVKRPAGRQSVLDR